MSTQHPWAGVGAGGAASYMSDARQQAAYTPIIHLHPLGVLLSGGEVGQPPFLN
jgi:hypothetical protein